jgi:hypothetical protein
MFDTEQNFIVLLDLEETVIDSWDDPVWQFKGQQVKKFLHGEWLPHPTPMQCKLGIMSWAIWDHRDIDTFNKHHREWLEGCLNFKFDDDLIFSMDDWARAVFEETRCKVSRQDLFDVCKKEDVLFKLRNSSMFHHTATWLIDDAVNKHDIIECLENRSKFYIRNVNSLFD